MKKPTTIHSTGAGEALIEDILIPEHRQRDLTDPAEINYIETTLMPSIAEYGVIQPPVLEYSEAGFEHNGKNFPFKLIAGECRIESCKRLGLKTVPYNLREEMSWVQHKILEFEENAKRKELPWQRKVLGIYEVHTYRVSNAVKDHETWGLRETGELIKVGKSSVNNAVVIGKLLLDGDAEIQAAKNMAAAMDVVLKRKNEEASQRLHEMTGVVAVPKKRTESSMGPMVRPETGKGIQVAELVAMPPVEKLQGTRPAPVVVPLSTMIHNGDSIAWMNEQAPASVDCIFTDIPYGIDMKNLDFTMEGIETVEDEHDVAQNVELMRPFLESSFRLVKDKGFVAFYCDVIHWEKLINWARLAGFSTQNWPVVWCKMHQCQNRSAGTNFTKATEYIMVLRKGTAVLANKRNVNFIMEDGGAEKKLYRHPFSKPWAVSKWVLDALTIKGDIVLDPFAGEGSLLIHAIRMQRQVRGAELSSIHFPRLRENLMKEYKLLTRGNCSFE